MYLNDQVVGIRVSPLLLSVLGVREVRLSLEVPGRTTP